MARKRGYFIACRTLAVLSLPMLTPLLSGQEASPVVNQDFVDGVNSVRDQDYATALTKLQAAVQADPNLEAAWHYIGVCQFILSKLEADPTAARQRLQDAATALQRAIELRPERPQTRLVLGQIYESLGAHNEAIAVYQEELRIQIGKKPVDAYNALARAYVGAGRYKEAMEAAHQAVLLDRNFVEAYYNWGRAADGAGDYKTAVEKLQRARDILIEWSDLQRRSGGPNIEGRIDPNLTEERKAEKYGRAEAFATEPGQRPALNKACGMAAMHAGQHDLARIAFRRALDPGEGGNPKDPDANTRIGISYYLEAKDLLTKEHLLFQPLQALKAAEKSLRDTLNESPDYPPAHNALGQVYLLRAQTGTADTWDQAEQEFQAAIQTAAQNGWRYVDAMVNLGRTYIGRQRYSEAINVLNDALAVEPNRADIHAELARAYVWAEQFDRAREEAETAIQLDRKQIEAYNAAGLAAYYVGDLGTAVEMYRKAIELDPTAHQSHTNLGLAFFQMRSWTRARDEFRLALKYLPEAVITGTAAQRAYLLYLTALTYSNAGLHEQAVRELNEALAVDPNYFEALRQLARDYAALRQFRASEQALRRALQQAPGDPEAAEVLGQLGQVYEAAGRPHDALAAYTEALTKDANNIEAQSGLARLQAS